jgi:hypothetical protein
MIMGKYLPKEAKPVDAFRWADYSRTNITEMIAFLNAGDFEWELFVNGNNVSIIVGDDDADYGQVRVDNLGFLVWDGEAFSVFGNATEFFGEYKRAGE